MRRSVDFVLVLLGTAAACGDAVASDLDYRILFPINSEAPISDGKEGDSNTQSYGRIAEAFKRLANLPQVRFIFVAPRQNACGSQEGCVPEQRMWQRVNTATVKIKRLNWIEGEALPFQRIGWAFLDDLPSGTFFSPARVGSTAIDLRLQIDALKTSGTCPWIMYFNDPYSATI